MNCDVVIIGGGAAGFFTAVNIAEHQKKLKIAILERGAEVLSKVKISGGGRCNVTHACFDPKELTFFYPRGKKELLGPFHQFCSGDTISWFEKHGVNLKIEEDNRIFPDTDSSQTIIDCLTSTAKKYNVEVLKGVAVQSIFKKENSWKVETKKGSFQCQYLVFASGSSPKTWEMLSHLGHKIVEPVPSLFTFNIKDKRLEGLMGVSTPALVEVKGEKLTAEGPLLITHWGMSGPGILKLSAWGARILAQKNYQFAIQVNWLPNTTKEAIKEQLLTIKKEHGKKAVSKRTEIMLPSRLWDKIVEAANIEEDTKWADLSAKQLNQLVLQLTEAEFKVNGKSTFKEEFVTAGGIELKEIDFKTMQSKLFQHLYFAGEVLNIDAITGGFNFQNAWTTGFIAARAIVENAQNNKDEI